jgi:hypothetical protein
MKLKFLVCALFATACCVLRAEPTGEMDIIGVVPPGGPDHLKGAHFRVRIANRGSVPLFYTAAGRDGVVVETETKINGNWISSSTVITGVGWERFSLEPGAALEATVPVSLPRHMPKDSPPLERCTVRLRFDCSKAQAGDSEVSIYSEERDPISANQSTDPAFSSGTPAAGQPARHP